MRLSINKLVAIVAILFFLAWLTSRKTTEFINFDGDMALPESPEQYYKERLQQKGGKWEPEKQSKAYKMVLQKYDKQQRSLDQKDGGLMGWEFKGPSNIGGRVRALRVRSNGLLQDELLAGSTGGGIWRSADSGVNWAPVNDFLPSLAITGFAYKTATTDTIYASTGEGIGLGNARPGAGIFKSVNGGLSWTQLEATRTSDFYWVNDIAVLPFPAQGDTLIAVTSVLSDRYNGEGSNTNGPGQIWRSTDGGLSWDSILMTNSRAYEVKVNPNNPAQILVACRNDSYVSDDFGRNFMEITLGTPGKLPANSGRCSFAWSSSTSQNVYASVDINSGRLYKSTDGGITWSFVSVTQHLLSASRTASLGWHANTLWVDPQNDQRLLLGGVEVYHSTDGGITVDTVSEWRNFHNGSAQNSAHADQMKIVESALFNTASNRKVYFSNDGGVQVTMDYMSLSETSGWINLSKNGLGISQLYAGAASPDGSRYGAAAHDNAFFTSDNQPLNWFQDTVGDGMRILIDPINPDSIYASLQSNDIFLSIDGGNSYQRVTNAKASTLGDNSKFVGPFVMDPDDPKSLLIGRNNLWRTNDAFTSVPANIKASLGPNIFISSIDIRNNGKRIWVGYDNGRVEFTINSGTVWFDSLAVPGNPTTMVTDIAINPHDISQAMVCFAGYSKNNIFFYNGANWFNRSLDFEMQVNTVTWHPTEEGWVYIGTDFGIFASEDYGQSWSITPLIGKSSSLDSAYYDNEGPLFVEVADLFWQGNAGNPYHLCAATHGRGLWVSSYPVLADVYVDLSYNGIEKGTFNQPYNTIQEALQAKGHGSNIRIKSSGDHNESGTVLFDKRGFVIPQGNPKAVIIR